MITGNYGRAVVLTAAAGLMSVALLAGGCRSEERSQLSRIPGERQLVGGGILIEWRAPERGTVYLLETETDKIVETRSVAEGDVYSFVVSSIVQAADFEELLGITFHRARFLLYFEPARGGAVARQ